MSKVGQVVEVQGVGGEGEVGKVVFVFIYNFVDSLVDGMFVGLLGVIVQVFYGEVEVVEVGWFSNLIIQVEKVVVGFRYGVVEQVEVNDVVGNGYCYVFVFVFQVLVYVVQFFIDDGDYVVVVDGMCDVESVIVLVYFLVEIFSWVFGQCFKFFVEVFVFVGGIFFVVFVVFLVKLFQGFYYKIFRFDQVVEVENQVEEEVVVVVCVVFVIQCFVFYFLYYFIDGLFDVVVFCFFFFLWQFFQVGDFYWLQVMEFFDQKIVLFVGFDGGFVQGVVEFVR